MVCQNFAKDLKKYGLNHVPGDRYTGMWPRERLQAYNIEYCLADKTKSDIYQLMDPQ
jgi:hypothetical protein